MYIVLALGLHNCNQASALGLDSAVRDLRKK